jgi:hypothetical protein
MLPFLAFGDDKRILINQEFEISFLLEMRRDDSQLISNLNLEIMDNYNYALQLLFE